MIEKANSTQLDEILALTRACAAKMINAGIFQWNEHYPSRAAFEEDLNRDELYIITQSGNIVGTIVISDLKDEVYQPVTWLTPADTKSIYIHRLAVHPDFQGQGIAQQLMDFAEDFARRNGYVSVRLDTFSQNPRNNRFYQKRGYAKLEEIFFPKQSEYPFYCYELVL